MFPLLEERVSPGLIWGSAAVSVLLHLLLILGLRTVPVIRPGTAAIEAPPRPVRLRFVDSPDRIEPVEAVPPTDLISDRSSLAQDTVPDRSAPDEYPRAVGTADYESIRKEPGGEPRPVEAPPRELAEGFEPGEGFAAGDPRAEPGPRIEARPASESPVIGKGDDDYWAPEEDSPEGRARILRQISYNMRSTEVGRYMARLVPRVVNLWHFNVMRNTFHVRSDRTHVLFKIMPDGSIGDLMVNKHDGPDLEMRYGINAIELAAPYEPLSEKILDHIRSDGLWLEFHFRYRR